MRRMVALMIFQICTVLSVLNTAITSSFSSAKLMSPPNLSQKSTLFLFPNKLSFVEGFEGANFCSLVVDDRFIYHFLVLCFFFTILPSLFTFFSLPTNFHDALFSTNASLVHFSYHNAAFFEHILETLEFIVLFSTSNADMFLRQPFFLKRKVTEE